MVQWLQRPVGPQLVVIRHRAWIEQELRVLVESSSERYGLPGRSCVDVEVTNVVGLSKLTTNSVMEDDQSSFNLLHIMCPVDKT